MQWKNLPRLRKLIYLVILSSPGKIAKPLLANFPVETSPSEPIKHHDPFNDIPHIIRTIPAASSSLFMSPILPNTSKSLVINADIYHDRGGQKAFAKRCTIESARRIGYIRRWKGFWNTAEVFVWVFVLSAD